MKHKTTIIYLYKRKYPAIEALLESLPTKYRTLTLTSTGARAGALGVCKVPSIVVVDKEEEVRVVKQGLESVKNYLRLLSET